MKLIKSVCFRFFLLLLTFCILSLVVWEGVSFAELRIGTGMKITEPKEGTIVNPGQEITVTIEAVDGFVLEGAVANIAGSEHNENIMSLPASFTDKIPLKAVGKAFISVFGRGVDGNLAMDDVDLIVEQTATLQSLEVSPDKLWFNLDWDGNIKGSVYDYIQSVYGLYSDGVKRDLDNDPNTTYLSSNPSVISVDSNGKVQAHKAGEATITASNSGINVDIPVTFYEPRGIRPEETVPPTTQIDIQPSANQVGWHNSDITITITAQDNEGGSGIRAIDYSILGTKDMQNQYIENAVVDIFFDREGVHELVYASIDKEGNYSQTHRHNIRLDKTPPQTTAFISPSPNESGWITSLPVKISFTATDNLSGISFTTEDKTITEDGVHKIEYSSRDVAGNNEETKSTEVRIDTASPQITLILNPLNLSDEHRKDKEHKKDKNKQHSEHHGNWYKLLYSAEDTLSGLKSLDAGLVILPIAGYKIALKENNQLEIRIDEKKKRLTIKAPNLQEILTQLQNGLLNFNNNQIIQLKLQKGRHPIWKIKQKQQGLEIQAPSITLKAEAEDYANNTATEELVFE